METTPRKQLLVRWFLQSYLGWIVVVLVLITVVRLMLVWLTVVLPYRREERIAKEIEILGGSVEWSEFTPDWIPNVVGDDPPILDRILCVDLSQSQVSDVALEHLAPLASLVALSLDKTQVTDVGLKHLMGLSSLENLCLSNAQITDKGLEHLMNSTGLRFLDLNDTQTTEDGKAKLHKALPDCRIEPFPS